MLFYLSLWKLIGIEPWTIRLQSERRNHSKTQQHCYPHRMVPQPVYNFKDKYIVRNPFQRQIRSNTKFHSSETNHKQPRENQLD